MTHLQGISGIINKVTGKKVKPIDDEFDSELEAMLSGDDFKIPILSENWIPFNKRIGDGNLVHIDSEFAQNFSFGEISVGLKDIIAPGAYLAAIGEQISYSLFKRLKEHWGEPLDEGFKVIGQNTKFVDFVYSNDELRFPPEHISFPEQVVDEVMFNMEGYIKNRKVIEVTTKLRDDYNKMRPWASPVLQSAKDKIREFSEDDLTDIINLLCVNGDSKRYHMIPPSISIGTACGYLKAKTGVEEGIINAMNFNFMNVPTSGRFQIDLYRPERFKLEKPQKAREGKYLYRIRSICGQIEGSTPLSYGELIVFGTHPVDFEPTIS